jgi:hypothetical protein
MAEEFELRRSWIGGLREESLDGPFPRTVFEF